MKKGVSFKEKVEKLNKNGSSAELLRRFKKVKLEKLHDQKHKEVVQVQKDAQKQSMTSVQQSQKNQHSLATSVTQPQRNKLSMSTSMSQVQEQSQKRLPITRNNTCVQDEIP